MHKCVKLKEHDVVLTAMAGPMAGVMGLSIRHKSKNLSMLKCGASVRIAYWYHHLGWWDSGGS